MNSKLLIFTLIITLSYSFLDFGRIQKCKDSILNSLIELKKISNEEGNIKTDGLTKFAKNVSNIMRECGLNTYAGQFDGKVPSVCIEDLNKGAKILSKIIGDKDNEAKIALDITFLQILYKKKIQKDCKFLSQTDFSFKSGGVCLQSAYQLSLVLQNLWENLGKGDTAAALIDLDTFLTRLPDTLDACGQSKWANQVRKDFPMQCLHSINDFAKQLSTFEHNYDHMQWLFKHWKQLAKSYKQVKKTCPLFA